ncbi:MAG: TonB family protein [Pseudomonadota bacterium]
MPTTRRRFLVMLWLSLALHALLIGFAQLPSPVRVPLPPEFSIEIAEPAPSVQAAAPIHEQNGIARPQRPAPPEPKEAQAAQAIENQVQLRAPQSAIQAIAPPALRLNPSPAIDALDAPGPVLDVPLLADARYYPARELDVPPAALRPPEPVYPPRAEEQGVAGRVLVRLYLEADGSIGRTEVVSVTPAGAYGEMFRQAALDSLDATRFRPAQRNGRAVRAVVEIPVVFEPDG